jgi:hypothetical protein
MSIGAPAHGVANGSMCGPPLLVIRRHNDVPNASIANMPEGRRASAVGFVVLRTQFNLGAFRWRAV